MQNITLRQKTVKKQKGQISAAEKARMWNVFDTEVANPDANANGLECIYRDCGNRESCDQCTSSLAFSEDGFLT